METLINKAVKSSNGKAQHKEGKVAKAIEKQTSRLPSDLFLWGAVASMAASLVLKLTKKDHIGLFIGQWVSPILIMGLYNKIVKVQGHDMLERTPA